MSTSYLAKTHIDPTSVKPDFTTIGSKPDYSGLKQRTEYVPAVPKTAYYPPVQAAKQFKKDDPRIPSELKSFMEDDDEEVSVAFDELMSEIAKYEVEDNKP